MQTITLREMQITVLILKLLDFIIGNSEKIKDDY